MEAICPPVPRRRRVWPWVVLALFLLTIAALAGAVWWYNRPITPVVLNAKEKAVVEAKLGAVQAPARPEPEYQKGGKEIIFTEREINGLLNERTTLGKSVGIELATGAVHARVETDLDSNIPVVGGKRLKARARFLVSGTPGTQQLVLDDVTVWGISLPNDWLGQMKGRNLLGEALGAGPHGLPGVEDLRVENGRVVIRLKE